VFATPLLEFAQIDRYDPAAVAAKLPAHTAVLLTCSNADASVGGAQGDHLATGLLQASARLDYVHLDGVDHFLKEDIAGVASVADVHVGCGVDLADQVVGHARRQGLRADKNRDLLCVFRQMQRGLPG
jgi:hypothetical protein